ncbi:MAG: hypothetical protein KDA58_12395, partial [Planctomycetaceae bacterium]|nr:hypothetical protein [Planctomycetaceae bacterium]
MPSIFAIHNAPLKADTIDDNQQRAHRGLEVLRRSLSWTTVAEYFNSISFPTGPYCRRTTWDGSMVKRLYANPILIGRPQRGKRHTVKNNETGRRISIVNPDGPTHREEPHLAFFTADELLPVLA